MRPRRAGGTRVPPTRGPRSLSLVSSGAMGVRMVSCDQRDGSPIGRGYYSYSNSVCDSGGQLLPAGSTVYDGLHQGSRAHAGKALFIV